MKTITQEAPEGMCESDCNKNNYYLFHILCSTFYNCIFYIGAAGPPPSGTEVTAHYTGTLEADGSKFDSSLDRGKPFQFTIGGGQVIKG